MKRMLLIALLAGAAIFAAAAPATAQWGLSNRYGYAYTYPGYVVPQYSYRYNYSPYGYNYSYRYAQPSYGYYPSYGYSYPSYPMYSYPSYGYYYSNPSYGYRYW
jgi:hypothetical protein